MGPTEPYIENPERFFLFPESLRKSLIRIGIVIIAFSFVGYCLANPVLRYFHNINHVQLAAYTITETFISLLTISLAIGVFISMPYIFYKILFALPPIFEAFSQKVAWMFLLASIILFYSGVIFCINITLPYGIKFLLGFQTNSIQAIISVIKYVSFCLFFIFGFGTIFLLPLVMILLGRIGLIQVQTLTQYRRYAILAVVTISAVLTPTPDIFNMALMAVPLYFLFEIGIIGMRIWKK